MDLATKFCYKIFLDFVSNSVAAYYQQAISLWFCIVANSIKNFHYRQKKLDFRWNCSVENHLNSCSVIARF